MNILLNNQDLQPILAGAPVISDQMEAVCRTLEFSVRDTESLENYLGQKVELWYGGKRWFVGFLRKRGRKHDGVIDYYVYDPLIFLAKNIDDWYFSGMTATQAIRKLAEKSGIRIRNLANTAAVFYALYYQGAEADKVAIDQLARTYEANKRKFWFNYKPDQDAEGLHLFERIVPTKLWAFQMGTNLVSAEMEESIEDTITVVKLINRETGKVVTKIDDAKLKAYGKSVHFEEVEREASNTMETRAKDLLKQLSKVSISQKVEGINPDKSMPQFFSGGYVYVEEKYTQIMGGYHIRNITQTFESDDLVRISMDVEADPYVPEVQFSDATKNPSEKEGKKGTGIQQDYSPEVKKAMEEYGV